TIEEAKRGPPVHPSTDSNVAAASGSEEEDEELEALLASAPHTLTHTIKHQRIAQSPLETRGLVVASHGEGELTVYIACQSPQMAARYLSLAFGIPQTSIRVISKDVGGSFGLKVQPWREEIAVIAAGMILGRPVKWIEDRLENLTSANPAREQEMTLRVAFDANGRLLASHADYSLNNGAYPYVPDSNIALMMFLWAAHKMPRFGFSARGWYTNTAGLAAYRGPWAMESLARETLLDIAARKIGIDPIELRRRNLVTQADQPFTTPLGIRVEDITPAQCLDALLQTIDVARFRAEQSAARAAGRYLGLGIATYIEPTAGSAGISVLASDVAQIRIEPTGKVSAVLSTHSQGHGTQTTMAQVIADRLGVSFEDVAVYEDDSSRGGFGAGASGSRQAVAGGGASIRAADLLVEKVKRVAAHLLNAKPDEIHIQGGMVHVSGASEKTRSLREIAEVAYGEPDRLPPGTEPGLEAQYRYRPPPITFTSAAHACIVDVDAETGFVKIKRWISSEDCGVMINPAVVEGQIAGGLTQAIGSVLLEEVCIDARGNPTSATYKDYLLPAISDVPDFEYVHASTPSQAEGGFRGVGEGGCIIGPPTLINAIADALSPFGELRLELPLTPSKILERIEGRTMSQKASGERTQASLAAGLRSVPLASDIPPSSAVAPASDPRTPVTENSGAAADGMWKMVLATPMGPQHFTGRFATHDDVLTGTLYGQMDQQDFTGTVAGNMLKWDLRVTKPVPLTLKYEVQIEGDKLAGKVKMGIFGTARLTGERM
ncbi:MAG TPA: molybdopterin cofactor-binding domain-containing protein, partial [Steroidobacteraceae bacterium]|nr:molybdopterin cofactor-binding domain-containing protein [Steroidobacteraceae bacterium]